MTIARLIAQTCRHHEKLRLQHRMLKEFIVVRGRQLDLPAELLEALQGGLGWAGQSFLNSHTLHLVHRCSTHEQLHVVSALVGEHMLLLMLACLRACAIASVHTSIVQFPSWPCVGHTHCYWSSPLEPAIGYLQFQITHTKPTYLPRSATIVLNSSLNACTTLRLRPPRSTTHANQRQPPPNQTTSKRDLQTFTPYTTTTTNNLHT